MNRRNYQSTHIVCTCSYVIYEMGVHWFNKAVKDYNVYKIGQFHDALLKKSLKIDMHYNDDLINKIL